MKQVVIPNTQLQTSRLGFGTASLHHLFCSRDRSALLASALDAGFNHFDTAPMYGEGMSERELGRFFGTERNHITIATKLGFPTIAAFEHFPPLLYAHRILGKIGRRIMPDQWDYRPRSLELDSVEQSLTRSLKALRTDWIDLLVVHESRVDDVGALLNLTKWLEEQRTSGRVRYLGLAGSVSNCVKVSQEIPGLFDVLQVEDSIDELVADDLITAGWPMQITYGYLRGAGAVSGSIDAKVVMQAALARNADGMILVSSRNTERLKTLASLADLDEVQS